MPDEDVDQPIERTPAAPPPAKSGKGDPWLRYLGPHSYFDDDKGHLFQAGGTPHQLSQAEADELLTFPDNEFTIEPGPDPEPGPPSEEKP